jgi:hypothetical protein
MWRRVNLVWTDFSEERRFTQDIHGATSQKTAFFIVAAVQKPQILRIIHRFLILIIYLCLMFSFLIRFVDNRCCWKWEAWKSVMNLLNIRAPHNTELDTHIFVSWDIEIYVSVAPSRGSWETLVYLQSVHNYLPFLVLFKPSSNDTAESYITSTCTPDNGRLGRNMQWQ